MNTIDRKIKIKDTTYIFRTPKETSLDALDIIHSGRIMMIKIGAMKAVDVNGVVLGRRGSAWNSQLPIEVDLPFSDLSINNAIERTKRILEAEEKNPGSKLYQLAVTSWNKMRIERTDVPEPHYYVNTSTRCDNCQQSILGKQILHVNHNGKVCKASTFIPYEENVVQRNGSKKFLHGECSTKSILVEELKTCQIQAALTEKTKLTLLEIIMETLEDPAVNAEFARGAAWFYLQMKELKE